MIKSCFLSYLWHSTATIIKYSAAGIQVKINNKIPADETIKVQTRIMKQYIPKGTLNAQRQ